MTGEDWVVQEYDGEDIDKWVFTRTDMEAAFEAGKNDINRETIKLKPGDKNEGSNTIT